MFKKLNFTKKLIFTWATFYLGLILLDSHYHFLPFGDSNMYQFLGQKVLNGSLPYRDFFFEYPPVSIFVFIFPQIFVNQFISYQLAFSFLNWLFCLTTLFLSFKIINFQNQKEKSKFLAFGTLIFFILSPLILTKYDAFPMFLTFLGIFFYLKKEKASFQILSYGLITLAGFTKIYSFVILPVLVIKEFKSKKYKKMFLGILTFLITSLPFFYLMYLGKNGLQYFLEYHAQRGLEIESTYSSVLLFLNQIGLLKNLDIVYTHASYGLSSPLANFLSQKSLVIFLVTYFFLCLKIFLEKKSSDSKSQIIKYSFLAILLFVLTNKVFSTQYLIWLLPFILILPYFYKSKKSLLKVLTIIVSVITIIIYPIAWEIFNKGNLALTIILLIRNLLLIFFIYKILPQKD